MLRNLFLKTLRDQRRSLIWWSLGAAALVALTIAFYPSIADSSEFDDMLENMPEALTRTFLGDVTDLTSPEGYLNSQLFVVMVPLLFLVFAIGRGSGAVAGEEEPGTLDLLLSYPVRRWRLVVDKFAAMTVAALVLGTTMWLALVVSAAAVDMEIGAGRLAEATSGGVLLALMFGSLALAVGCATGKRSLSIASTSGLAIAAYFVNALSPLVDALEPARLLSPFYYYAAGDPLSNGLDPWHVLLMAGLTVVFLIAGLVLFQRRDLAV